MSGIVEAGLLLLALVAVVLLATDLVRGRLKERSERDLLARLLDEAPEGDDKEASGPGTVERRLRAAGLPGPVEAYAFGLALFAAGVTLLTLQVLPSLPFLALIALGFALYLPWKAITEWAQRRARRFEQLLIEAIDLMAGALFAGSNLSQAFRSAGNVAENPVRGEFLEVDRRLALGMPLPRAFGRMVEGFDSEGVRLFTQTLAAKQTAGGDLAPVLRSLNETLRDRWRQQRQVRAQLAGVRVSALLVALLPYVFAPVLVWLRPEWFDALLGHPIGIPALFLAILLQLVGIVWLWHILSREL